MKSFNVSEEQLATASAWMKERAASYTGASGGQFSWVFTSTTIGLIVVVVDNMTKEQIDLTNYKEW